MSLVLGIGASSKAQEQEIDALITKTLAHQGLSKDDVHLVSTRDTKRNALARLCARNGWDLVTHSAEELDEQPVPNPSGRFPRSVAEAAAQIYGDLVVTKTASEHATVAVARRR